MRYIVIGNVLVYLLDMFSLGSGGAASSLLSFNAHAILQGQIWRVVTFVFVPYSSGLFFFLVSLYFYYLIGTALERQWGYNKFTIFYLFGVLMNIIVGFLAGTASMYYVNMSMFFAFATLYPDLQFLLFFIIPIKARWLAWIDAGFFIWQIVQYLAYGAFLYALFPVIALLNYLLFFASDISNLFSGLGRRAGNAARNAGGPRVVNFGGRPGPKKQDNALHRCAVCGKTDISDPMMEFRYCSQCNGYYCYCMDHISRHVHIQ